VGVTDVAHAEEPLKKRDSFVDEVARLRHERDTALTEIRIFVGNEVNATLGDSAGLKSPMTRDPPLCKSSHCALWRTPPASSVLKSMNCATKLATKRMRTRA
jgi:hypothetical protein